MSATLHQIKIRPILQSEYNDTNLGHEGMWIMDNAVTLARRWQQLGRALGLDDADGEDDLQMWLKEQHEQQMRRRVARMLPHGGTL